MCLTSLKIGTFHSMHMKDRVGGSGEQSGGTVTEAWVSLAVCCLHTAFMAHIRLTLRGISQPFMISLSNMLFHCSCFMSLECQFEEGVLCRSKLGGKKRKVNHFITGKGKMRLIVWWKTTFCFVENNKHTGGPIIILGSGLLS